MATKIFIQELVKNKIHKNILSSYDFITNIFNDFSIELLSADYVQINSFKELGDWGGLYVCNNDLPFLCMTKLNIPKNCSLEISSDHLFTKPLMIFAVALAAVDDHNNDNVIIMIFLENEMKNEY